MREIKFRAWWTHPESDSSGFDYFEIGQLYEPKDLCQIVHCFEQFTSLHDKNGKEIYEGDIVVLGDSRLIVLYQAPSFVMKHKPKAKTWNEFILEASQNQFCEVVGNIHENPELMNA